VVDRPYVQTLTKTTISLFPHFIVHKMLEVLVGSIILDVVFAIGCYKRGGNDVGPYYSPYPNPNATFDHVLLSQSMSHDEVKNEFVKTKRMTQCDAVSTSRAWIGRPVVGGDGQSVGR